MTRYFIILILFASGLLVSCGSKSENETEVASNEAHADENPNTATLTEAQIQSIGISFGKVEQKQLTASLKTNGILQVPNQNKASVNSLYIGIVKSLTIQPGNTVKKGEVLATISNPEFIRVQEEYLGIAPKITLSELDVKRQEELNAGNAGALKNLQAAQAELRSLKAQQASLDQQIRLMGLNPLSLNNGKLVSVLSVRSPINGVVSTVGAKIGSYIDVNTIVAEIVDNSQLHLDLFVYEKDLSKLKNNQTIHFTLTNNPGKEYDAQIYSLGSSFEGESKAVTVHARVQGDKTGLIDGMTITAAISLEKATVPAVPSDAIVTISGQDFIFMLTDEHAEEEHTGNGKDSIKHDSKEQRSHQEEKGLTFEKIPVAKGTSDVGYTEITLLKEIPKDAKIVVKGAFFVLAKMTNSGEHEH
jgi:cobalt-zinc-cadmium efflux system membrane fusion protein